MQPKHPWLQKCLEKLEELPQIKTTTTVEPFQVESAIADGLLTIYTPQKKLEYIVEIKSHLTHETLDIALNYLKHLRQRLSDGQRPLLVTDVLSDALVNELLEQNIEFIDTTGNIYLNNSSIYILINSSSFSSKKAISAPKITTSTLKVAYALLQDPKILKALPEDIVEVTGVDLNTVKDSLDSLYELNYLQRQPGGKYRIENYTILLERWEMGYVENLRPELLINIFSPIGNIHFSDISNKIIEIAQPHKILIGGEFGAAIITGYLKPISTVLHIPNQENYRVITTKLRLKPDHDGSISILKQFGNKNECKDCQSKPVVDPLLIHAELALHPDERLKETAKRLYDQHIAKRQQIAEMV
ncbi:hypothetical protein ICL16_41185 [Iningainema sp. BLCCT55]|uniref:Uncharacterized protein n=2 Tax=Iningainema TaxID=1932705 RepID=A0A8J7CBF3_9CYAN|nr:hypothetical protein [Iningainema tapete BLCC-T55]